MSENKDELIKAQNELIVVLFAINKILQSITINLDAILLDNMPIDETKRCIDLIRNKLPLCFIESSGGINLQSISKYRKIDVDGISIGALTHQAVSKNIKFEFE